MKKIKFCDDKFDNLLYDIKTIYCITCDKFWDGGYITDVSLSEKAEFYNIANQFSSIIKSLINTLNDSIIISDKITEHGSMFEHWKNSNKYDCFNNLCNYIKKRNSYSLVLPDDNNIVDYIIENNFRYFTSIDFYLPKNKIILQPTCHTEIFIYSENYEPLIPIIKNILKNYSGFRLEPYKQSL